MEQAGSALRQLCRHVTLMSVSLENPASWTDTHFKFRIILCTRQCGLIPKEKSSFCQRNVGKPPRDGHERVPGHICTHTHLDQQIPDHDGWLYC